MGTWGLACSGTVVGDKHRLAVPGRPPRARRREALRLLGCKSVRNIGTKSHANERRGRLWAGGSADHDPSERGVRTSSAGPCVGAGLAVPWARRGR
jgi:hypothetical protein